ncbi:MAG TPA: hypothetical protein VFZ89_14455 [Solirubrobacteraceae bacterium]
MTVCATLSRESVRAIKRLADVQRRPDLGCSDLVIRQLRLAGIGKDAQRQLGRPRTSRSGATHVRVHAQHLEATGGAGVRLVREGRQFRLVLADVFGVARTLEASERCAAARVSILAMPPPPLRSGAWPAYLRDAAGRARAAAKLGVDNAGAILTTAGRLRRLARPPMSDAAVDRAASLLIELQLDVASLELTQADCGEMPHQTTDAIAFRERLRQHCDIRDVGQVDAMADAATQGRLPALLDPIRDQLVADIRRGVRVARTGTGADGISRAAITSRVRLAFTRLNVC